MTKQRSDYGFGTGKRAREINAQAAATYRAATASMTAEEINKLAAKREAAQARAAARAKAKLEAKMAALVQG